jgi:hypothetical protein
MRFPNLTSQAEIDAQLRRTIPRTDAGRNLPWGPAIIGISVLVMLQTLF